METVVTLLEEEPETLMSNFDHTIDDDVRLRLMDGKRYAQYSGWNFCGFVCRDATAGMWVCEVWVRGFPVETFRAETLREIMSNVSGVYGEQ